MQQVRESQQCWEAQSFASQERGRQQPALLSCNPSPTSCHPAGTGYQTWVIPLLLSSSGRDVVPHAAMAGWQRWPLPPQGRMHLMPFAHATAARHSQRWLQARGVHASSPGLKA